MRKKKVTQAMEDIFAFIGWYILEYHIAPDQRTIAAETGISLSWVNRCMKRLAALGKLEFRPNAGHYWPVAGEDVEVGDG